jgi:hypothetical protein
MGEGRAYFGRRLQSVLNRTEPEHIPYSIFHMEYGILSYLGMIGSVINDG